MPLQNRVTPGGDLVAASARGTVMGNRGILHDDQRRIVRTSRNTAWLICRLEFNDRRRAVMSPGTYTELFFLDEAVALAAGHRPCGECRRDRYRAYLAAVGVTGAREVDARLNASRRTAGAVREISALPDGVFVELDEEYRLLWCGALHRWTAQGYDDPIAVSGHALVVTPALTVAALGNGYRPDVHASVRNAL